MYPLQPSLRPNVRGQLAPKAQHTMLTDAFEALSPASPDPQEPTWIRKSPGVCGGEACIRNTRIPVWVLEGYTRLGLSGAQLLGAYPTLTRDDLLAARAYAT